MRPFSFDKCVFHVLFAVAILLVLNAPVFAASTELHIVKYANDIINGKTEGYIPESEANANG